VELKQGTGTIVAEFIAELLIDPVWN